jgi:hypothetical protein
MPVNLWLPQHLRPAVKRTRVVFYHNPTTDHVLVGFPEQFPCPHAGYQKIVCQNAAEVDRWDKKLREQERRTEEMSDEQREAIEAPVRRAARADLYTKMINARNEINRAFCRHAIEQIDAYEESLKKKKVESFQHIVGYEDGK